MIESHKKWIGAKDIFDSIYNNSPIGIEIYDSNGKLFDVNKSCMQLFGVSKKDDIKGFDLFTDLNIPLEYLSRLKQRKTVRYESEFDFDLIKNQNLYKTSRSGKIYVDVLITPLSIGEPNSISNFLVQIQDITDRKIAEQKQIFLNEELEKRVNETSIQFDRFIEVVPMGIIIVSNKGRLIECNSYAFKILGYESKEEILETIASDHYCNLKDMDQFIEMHKKSGIVNNLEVLLKRKDNTKLWATITSTLQNRDNQKVYFTVFQDITERKRTEQKLKESEERFRSTFEQAAIGISHNALDGTFLRVNQGLCDIVKYSREELYNLTFQNITYPDDLEAYLELVSQLLNNEIQSFTMEKRYICKDKSLVWVNLTGSLVRDQPGEPKYFIAVIEDINEKKIAEQRLRESEKRYKELIEAIPVGISITTPDGRMIEANSQAFKIFGYDLKEEFLNVPVVELYYDPKEREKFVELHKKGLVKEFEVRYKRKDGTLFWGSLTSIAQTLGEHTVFLNTFQDITERKRAEQKLIESEENYKKLSLESELILDNIPGLIFYKDLENNFIKVNKYVADAHEVSKDFLKGKSMFELYPEEQAQAYWDDDLDVTQSGKAKLNIEEPWETLKGKRWVNTSKIPIIDRNKKVIGILGVSTDITEKRLAQEKLKESEEKFRTIAEQSLLGLVIQQDGVLKFVNSAISNILEYPLREIKNWTVDDTFNVIHEEDLPYVREKSKSREEWDYTTIINYECRMITKSGNTKWIEVMSKPITYLEKHAILITMIDITDQKKIEKKLKDISRLKSDLLSRTSHELKTPLVSIKGYVDLLLQVHYENLDFYTISMLHEIRQGCSRLETLIKDLLETSKLETGSIQLKKEQEDLSFLIKYCVKDLQGLARIRHHKLFVDISDEMITMFEKERIFDVIVNLLSNAIKYTPPNGIIKIESEIKDNNYIISFDDNGIGIPEAEKDKIFQKFGKIERYGKGLDVVSEGSGLGLYISKGIIELHGGQIWVQSKGRKKGTIFYFSLPIINE